MLDVETRGDSSLRPATANVLKWTPEPCAAVLALAASAPHERAHGHTHTHFKHTTERRPRRIQARSSLHCYQVMMTTLLLPWMQPVPRKLFPFLSLGHRDVFTIGQRPNTRHSVPFSSLRVERRRSRRLRCADERPATTEPAKAVLLQWVVCFQTQPWVCPSRQVDVGASP